MLNSSVGCIATDRDPFLLKVSNAELKYQYRTKRASRAYQYGME
jgi:hypothetical protein